MANRWGNNGNSERLYFWGSKITADGDCSHKIKALAPWRKSCNKSRQHIRKQRHHFANKGPSSQGYGFSVVMYGCESWTVKKAECQRIDVFELCVLLWEFLGLQVQPVHHKGDQSSVFTGRTNEAESPILWPPDAKSWLIWKDPDAGKDWRQEKGMTEDEIVGWHHWLDGHGFGWTLGVGDGQGGLACCSSWGCKELDTTEQLNWTEVKSLSRVRLFAIPWTVAYQALPSMEFSKQEYWSGLPFPAPGDLPDLGIELRSPTL